MHCRRIVLCLLCSCQSLLAVSTPTECTASSSACAGSDTAALLQGRLDMSREREPVSPTTDTHTSPGEDHKEDEGDKDDEGDEDGEDNDDNGEDQEDHEDHEDHKEDEGVEDTHTSPEDEGDVDGDEDGEDDEGDKDEEGKKSSGKGGKGGGADVKDEGDKDDEGDEDGEDNNDNEGDKDDEGDEDGEDQDSSAKEGGESSGRRRKGNKKPLYIMPIAEAGELDAAAMIENPDMLPMVPILFPEKVEAHDKDIASKIQDLTRDRRIRLPAGEEISYWQTLQYANRHFRLFVREILDSEKNTSKWFNTTKAQKVQLWGVSGILRKMLCHPDFLEWTVSKTEAAKVNNKIFGKTNQEVTVYERFEAARRQSWVGFSRKTKALGTMTAGGMILKRPRSFNGLLRTFMHEMSHLLGYPHSSGVPYDSADFIEDAIKNNIASYEVYDLTSTPNFELL